MEKDNKYSTDDIATTLNVSIRTAQRYVESLVNKGVGKLFFERDVFDLIISRHSNDNQTTEDDTEIITDYFTPDQYEEFRKRLIEYPMLKKHIEGLQSEIEYHKNQYKNLMHLHKEFMEMHQTALNNNAQRNWIEAKEKRLDNGL